MTESEIHLLLPLLHPSTFIISLPRTSLSMHPSIIIRYPTSSRALFHPSTHHHYVPTSSSIHPSSLCTHFFIHPFFHPSIIIIISGRAHPVPGRAERRAPWQARHENHRGPNRAERWPVTEPSRRSFLVKLMYVRFRFSTSYAILRFRNRSCWLRR
jgi:hypothetical protein